MCLDPGVSESWGAWFLDHTVHVSVLLHVCMCLDPGVSGSWSVSCLDHTVYLSVLVPARRMRAVSAAATDSHACSEFMIVDDLLRARALYDIRDREVVSCLTLMAMQRAGWDPIAPGQWRGAPSRYRDRHAVRGLMLIAMQLALLVGGDLIQQAGWDPIAPDQRRGAVGWYRDWHPLHGLTIIVLQRVGATGHAEADSA